MLVLQAEEIFDVASRYLLFPLKRAVADALLPHLETATLAEICQWLVLSDMYALSSYLSPFSKLYGYITILKFVHCSVVSCMKLVLVIYILVEPRKCKTFMDDI